MRSRPNTARPVCALLALSASTFAYVTTETLPIGLVPTLADGLHVSESAIGLLVTIYALVVVMASIPLTTLTRTVPRRPLLSGLLLVFAAAGLVSVVSSEYWIVLVARIVTALSQALFWSVVIPTAAALFEPHVRGRAIAVVFAGSSLAAVIGVPAGTWLGQEFGWRMPFAVLSAVALIAGVAVAVLLPNAAAGTDPDAPATAPDRRYFRRLLLVTAVAITGIFVALTYITPFLTDVAGFAGSSVGPVLFVRGLAGLIGVWVGGLLADRSPATGLLGSLALQALSLTGLALAGSEPAVALVLVAASGLSMSAFTTVLAGRVLQVAPGRTDLGAAAASTAVNVGITVGALGASVLLAWPGVRSTATAGAVLSAVALLLMVCTRPSSRAQTTPPAKIDLAADTTSHSEPSSGSHRRQ